VKLSIPRKMMQVTDKFLAKPSEDNLEKLKLYLEKSRNPYENLIVLLNISKMRMIIN
jgi:hypothetical protein